MNVCGPLIFDIQKIHTLIHKHEDAGFNYICRARAWDGFVIITEGKCIFDCKTAGYFLLNAGDIIFLRKKESYSIIADESISYYTAAFDFSPESDDIMNMMPKISRCDSLLLKTVAQLNESWQRQDLESYIFCKIQFLKIYYDKLRCVIDECSCSDASVNKAVQFLHSNFKKNFSSEELAKYCSISESHLRKKFRHEMKMTILEYRDMLRFRLAKELLSSGLFNIKEASYELGFCDVYYFTKFFKRFSGLTPKRYIIEKKQLLQ